MTIVN